MAQETQKSHRGKGWSWCFVMLIAAGLIGGSGFLWLDSRGIEIRQEAIRIFKSKAIAQSFSDWREIQIFGNPGNILEVATATGIEKFSRRSCLEIFGRSVVSKTSNISVPATYRFHIDLMGRWKVIENKSRLIITVPTPQPTLPVAYDTTGMKKSVNGMGKYLPTNDMDELEEGISENLAKRANDPKILSKVREESRRSIALFLQTWLLKEDQWRRGEFEELVILFEGEDPNSVAVALTVENIEA